MSAITIDFDDHLWFLSEEESSFVQTRNKRYRLGFAALMKFFQHVGRFPESLLEIPTQGLQYLSKQLDITLGSFAQRYQTRHRFDYGHLLFVSVMLSNIR